jgi:peptidoglycan DL-endopeptidase LytF
MNRKRTIIIAVLINAGLVAVLALAGLTGPEETQQTAQNAPLVLPPFDQHPLLEEQLASVDVVRAPVLDVPMIAEEPAVVPVIHKLPEPPASVPVVQSNTVTVKKGDTLDKIAKAHKTQVAAIVKLNQLPNSFLKVGQVLQLPTSSEVAVEKPVAAAPKAAGSEYYTMKVGESPWAVAKKHQMKVEDLLKLNGLNEEKARKLKPGDRLRIR